MSKRVSNSRMPASSFSSPLLIAIFATAVGCGISLAGALAQAQSTGCLLYPGGSTPPSGYSASWDVFDASKRLLVTGGCTLSADGRMPLTIGAGDSLQLVYNQAYSYRDGQWRLHTLTGTVSGSDWLIGRGTAASGIATPASVSASSPFYFVGYVCTNRSGQWKCGCRDAACTQSLWQLQAYRGTAPSGSSGLGGGGISEGGGVVKVIPGRTVHMKPNDPGSGIQERIQIGRAADEYYLDFNVKYDNRYDWDSRDQSGKFPGLAGGAKEGGGNCTGEQPDSWSARNGFQNHGRMTTYLYFQNRNSGCGVKYQWKNPNGSDFYFERDRTYRFTQRVKVNTPGVADGHNQIWVDGVEVYRKTDMEWRGNVSPSVARVDQVMFHAFFGGDTIDKTASYDSYVHFGDMYVMSCRPDFSRAAGTCAN